MNSDAKSSRRSRLTAWGLSAALGATLLWPGAAVHADNPAAAELAVAEDPMLVTVLVKDRAAVDRLLEQGVDVEHRMKATAAGYEIDLVVTPTELAALEKQGVRLLHKLFTKSDWQARIAERNRVLQAEHAAIASVDEISVLRADYFTNASGSFLYVEAKSSAGNVPANPLKATWAGGEATLSGWSDSGQYMYHYLFVPVTERPADITITSALGGTATVPVNDWVGEDIKPPKPDKHYVSDFITHYMNPTEIYDRIESLAAEYPDLAEIVELPNLTNGYRRHAQAVLGSAASSSVVVTSAAYGSEGGNGLAVEMLVSAGANAPLTVTADGKKITVHLATDASGAASSTAAQVVSALNEKAGHLVAATTYRGNAGGGKAAPTSAVTLSDGLKAPSNISRDPFQVRAIRIGKHRDGSKTGVMAYSQEHAREWVTPLVSLETAERLLRNYGHDAETKKLVNNLDIFIIPSVNPDGAHYSFFDYNMQRKNMTNHCGPAASDPLLRNNWGVDVNRNYRVGSVFDGYAGASATNCQSGTYAGPAELSEPESKNVVWLAENFTNIKFAMNVHSYGGYFMWPPGAYKASGRETLPRPTAGEEAFFWAASERILDEIKEHRGTVIFPGYTGPVIDVLYSAAGNSADDLWYNQGIYGWDFEVGADLFDPATQSWRAVGFQPPFEEGHQEALEFSNGLIGLLNVAHDFGKDRQPPKSKLAPGAGAYTGAVDLHFETSEPATVYYTLDGSRPTFTSEKVKLGGTREGAAPVRIDRSATVNWFSVDPSGNVEGNYNPLGSGKNFNSAVITIK